MYIRQADQRGHAQFEWLNSYHTFSFGHYYDPSHMGWGALKVINDDTVAAGAGFDTHGHRDMEIVTYVLTGSIRHRDSMGNESVLKAGEVQRMTAGTGVMHSEYNDSAVLPLQLLQIWVLPNQKRLVPGYEQKAIPQQGRLTPLITPDGRAGSLSIHQNVEIQRLILAVGESMVLTPTHGRKGYLHLIAGNVAISLDTDPGELSEGDGVGLIETESLSLKATQPVEALWFDAADA